MKAMFEVFTNFYYNDDFNIYINKNCFYVNNFFHYLSVASNNLFVEI